MLLSLLINMVVTFQATSVNDPQSYQPISDSYLVEISLLTTVQQVTEGLERGSWSFLLFFHENPASRTVFITILNPVYLFQSQISTKANEY